MNGRRIRAVSSVSVDVAKAATVRTFLVRLRDTCWRCLPPSRKFDVSTLPKPPWIVKPEWPPDSLGWRMGGEQYLFELRNLYAELSATDQAAYERAYPVPPGWRGYLAWKRKGLRFILRPPSRDA